MPGRLVPWSPEPNRLYIYYILSILKIIIGFEEGGEEKGKREERKGEERRRGDEEGRREKRTERRQSGPIAAPPARRTRTRGEAPTAVLACLHWQQ